MTKTIVECGCGACKVELSGDPMAQFYCHCSDCQRAHGAGYIPVAVYKADAVKLLAGDTAEWKVKVTPRTTCKSCGTRLFQEPPGLGVRGVNALLLPKGTFRPAWHHQCAESMVKLGDDLPHFKGFPAAFGGSDDKVSW